LSQNPADLGETQNPVPQRRDGAECPSQDLSAEGREEEKPFFSENEKFVFGNDAPHSKSHRNIYFRSRFLDLWIKFGSII
jgi:hypothetical protein